MSRTRLGESPDKRRRRRLFEKAREREWDLIEEIVATAECITSVRQRRRRLGTRDEGVWRLLETIEQSRYCLSISDVARRLRIPRQRAHELVRRVARAGYVDALPNPDDRRILQVFLTPSGRSELAHARTRDSAWISTSMLDLNAYDIVKISRTLRVIRYRLSREDGGEVCDAK